MRSITVFSAMFLVFCALVTVSTSSELLASNYLNESISSDAYKPDYLQQVNDNRLSRLEVKKFLKDQQLGMLIKLDLLYQSRNKMNRLVEPAFIKKPPEPIVDRVKYRELLKEQIELKQEIINLYYLMEKQVYEWESLTLINEHVRYRAEQDMHFFRKYLLDLLTTDDQYLIAFEKLILFYETDHKAYFLIDDKLHFVREESMRYFETLQDQLESHNDKLEHYVFVIKDSVRTK